MASIAAWGEVVSKDCGVRRWTNWREINSTNSRASSMYRFPAKCNRPGSIRCPPVAVNLWSDSVRALQLHQLVVEPENKECRSPVADKIRCFLFPRKFQRQ